MLAPAFHQLFDSFHALTVRAGLPTLDRVFPLLILAVVVLAALLAALRHRLASHG